MAMAHVLAKRSYDPRLQVGCLIVDHDNRVVLGVGYNGNARKLPNEPDSLELGLSGFVHAEANAIINCTSRIYSANVYVTHSPCMQCAKMLINGGIWSLHYATPYRDEKPLEMLRRSGVCVYQATEEPSA
jgi:dCMP deaminase